MMKAFGKPGHRIYAATTKDGLDAIDRVIKEAEGDAKVLQATFSTVPYEMIRSGTKLQVISSDDFGRVHVRLLNGQKKGRLLWVHSRMLK